MKKLNIDLLTSSSFSYDEDYYTYTSFINECVMETELNQKEFVAWHAVDNPASGAVMRKCGFIYENNDTITNYLWWTNINRSKV